MEIKIEGLEKKYGSHEALKKISLTIPKGMYGLLGKNGAGKTTLLRILATLITKTEGRILMNGIPIEKSKEVRKKIGYMPQNFSVYPNMTVHRVMEYFDMLSEMPKEGRKNRINILLNEVNLDGEKNRKVRALSGGMRQRLGIALALLNNPEIIIVDEPTAGLDPEERIRLRNLLVNLADEKIVLLSTHIVDDIAATCKRVGVLHEGELLFAGDVKELAAFGDGRVFTINGIQNEVLPDGAIIINQNQEFVRILSDICPSGKYEENSPSLEDGYIELIREKELSNAVN